MYRNEFVRHSTSTAPSTALDASSLFAFIETQPGQVFSSTTTLSCGSIPTGTRFEMPDGEVSVTKSSEGIGEMTMAQEAVDKLRLRPKCCVARLPLDVPSSDGWRWVAGLGKTLATHKDCRAFPIGLRLAFPPDSCGSTAS
jgi:hypothetical protein